MNMRKFLAVLTLLPLVLLLRPLSGSAQEQATNRFARWEKEIAAFEAADKTNPPPQNAILFIGSSSIRMWQSLAKDFPEHQVINRGFGGSHLADSVHFADRIVFPYQPRTIVLYAGTNDINDKKTPEQVLADFKAFVAKVHARLPETRIAFISTAPNPARWKLVEQFKTLNRLAEEYTKTNPKLAFIDVFTPMLGEDGQPSRDIYLSDKLHMNAQGYAIWKQVIGRYLN